MDGLDSKSAGVAERELLKSTTSTSLTGNPAWLWPSWLTPDLMIAIDDVFTFSPETNQQVLVKRSEALIPEDFNLTDGDQQIVQAMEVGLVYAKNFMR